INAILDETTCVTIPTVKLKNDGDIKSFFVDSIAVFNYDNTFSYILGRKASESVVKLSGEIENGTIVTEDEKGNKATFIIVDGKTKYNVRVENGVLIYDVKIKLYCDLNAYEGDNFKPIEKETVEIFKRNIESDVKRSVSETYGIILQYGSYDILRFGRRLLQSEKESYKFLKNDWQENFRNSQLNADIDIVIRRIGEESYN
ncbi:MAG: hypothetical protein IKC01_00725, partial [Clostridia bacterium]|nr:hypothetical protein [Clostridia bacterium]